MKENIIQKKSYNFAIKIIGIYKLLSETKKEYVLSKQLLRSGTSIGANIEEALGGYSRNDWLAKMAIAYKEARETRYWLSLLRDTGYLEQDMISPLFAEVEEICKIIGSIQKTAKTNP